MQLTDELGFAVFKNRCVAIPDLTKPPWNRPELVLGDVDRIIAANSTLHIGELDTEE